MNQFHVTHITAHASLINHWYILNLKSCRREVRIGIRLVAEHFFLADYSKRCETAQSEILRGFMLEVLGLGLNNDPFRGIGYGT
jgi:hypothetical protein